MSPYPSRLRSVRPEDSARVMAVHASTVVRALHLAAPASRAHCRGRWYAAGAAALAERVARGNPLPDALAEAHEEAHARAGDPLDLGSLPPTHLQAYVRGLNSAARALRAGDFIARNPYVSHGDISRALRAARAGRCSCPRGSRSRSGAAPSR